MHDGLSFFGDTMVVLQRLRTLSQEDLLGMAFNSQYVELFTYKCITH